MKKIFKWAALVLGGLVGVLIITAGVLFVIGGSRLNKHYDVQVEELTIPADSASIVHGRHIAEAVSLCMGCHGDDLSGGALIDEPSIATVYASNLTSGRGGVGSRYTDADFVRSIRHGVNPAGRGLMIMHADAYHNMSRGDLANVISYVKSVPPVDLEQPTTKGGPLGKVFVALGMFDSPTMPLIPAEMIDHSAGFSDTPPPGLTPEYGEYLVSIALCRMCHGAAMTGGPPIDEGAPAGPNVAVYASRDGWSQEAFANTLRTGVTPYGRSLDPEYMPWKMFGKMTDEELGAIYLYLASLNEE